MNPCEKVYFDEACIHFILVFNEVIALKFGQSSNGVAPRLCHRSPYRMRGEWSFDIWIKTTYETSHSENIVKQVNQPLGRAWIMAKNPTHEIMRQFKCPVISKWLTINASFKANAKLMIKLASFFRMDFQKFDGMVIFSCKSFFWEIWLSTENKKVILHSWCIFDTLN